MKGVTPQLSLLSGWYWHLGEEEKPGQSRWQLQNPHGRRLSAAGIEHGIHKAHPQTMDKPVLVF